MLIPGLTEEKLTDLDELLAKSEVDSDINNSDDSGDSEEANDSGECSDCGESDGTEFDDSLVNLAQISSHVWPWPINPRNTEEWRSCIIKALKIMLKGQIKCQKKF